MQPKIAFFDTKPYERESFDRLNDHYKIHYFESRLTPETAHLADGYDAVCAFVNDQINAETLWTLYTHDIRLIAMRCAGYNNVDLKTAYNRICIVRVPADSPHAVAEHAMGLLLAINRHLHKAYTRTREFNFSIVGLDGVDLFGKTVGVIGTGKIGRTFIDICRGFGMQIIAYDPHPNKNEEYPYVSLETLLAQSDVISLHCPLTAQSYRLLNREAFSKMKRGVYIINTSRGALIDSKALLDALNQGIVRAAGLDIYEEDYFYEERSHAPTDGHVLALLVSHPNVLITSHQAFFTQEALNRIAETTLRNFDEFFENRSLSHEVIYRAENCSVSEMHHPQPCR